MHGDAALYSPADIKWQEGPPSLPPGAKVAMLEGDLAKEGPFVIRAKLPDGYHVPPHTHPKTEHVTVLSGNFKIAMGESSTVRQPAACPREHLACGRPE